MQVALFVACGLLLIGFLLRAWLKILQVLYVPAAVIGGIVGVVALTLMASRGSSVVSTTATDVIVELRSWPGWLISVIFAGLLIERPGKSLRNSLKLATREGIVVWIIVLGEITLGVLATWLVIKRFYDVPGSFGQLIEAGFAGGHGTATALGEVFKDSLKFEKGRDLGLFFATVGLVYGVVSGIVYINIATRKGWTRAGNVKIPLLRGTEARHQPEPIAYGKVRSEVIDPLVFQGLILAVAFMVGLALKAVFMEIVPLVASLFETSPAGSQNNVVHFASKLPTFMFTLFAGLLVREAMHLLKIGDLIDPDSMRRITGAAMEFLIVAAVASLNVSAVAEFGWPIALLLLLGFIWTGFCLFFIARMLLPKAYWFELGILNYGMSTGTTAQGLMLLRIIDKDLESGAAEDYALAAPLSAPFIGGGVITLIVLPQLLETEFIGLVALGLVLAVVGLYFFGRRLAKQAATAAST